MGHQNQNETPSMSKLKQVKIPKHLEEEKKKKKKEKKKKEKKHLDQHLFGEHLFADTAQSLKRLQLPGKRKIMIPIAFVLSYTPSD